mmetsp:Transcript_2163/g.4945  ORF Transcript_2163/g.4945 Transcript_2163/m.4945 type:complete len:600 (-) Transcript_2163:200-1999(-)
MPRFAWAPEDVTERGENARALREVGSGLSGRCPQTPPPRGRGPPAAVTPQLRRPLRRERAVATPTCAGLEPSSPQRRPQMRGRQSTSAFEADAAAHEATPAPQVRSRATPVQQPQPLHQRTTPRAQHPQNTVARGMRRSQGELQLKSARGAPAETETKARPVRDVAPPRDRDDGLRAALQACESELLTERSEAAERANALQAKLVKAESKENRLLEELESMRRKLLHERSRRRTAELDVERLRMQAEDTRKVDVPVGSRRNATVTPLSPTTPVASQPSPRRTPSPEVLCQAESLVLEMFGSDHLGQRTGQGRLPVTRSRSPSSKEQQRASREPEPSPSTSSAPSETSIQTEPPSFPSLSLRNSTPTATPTSADEQKPMLLALNGCMPSFPSAEPAMKGLDRRRRSCPLFEPPNASAAAPAATAAWGHTRGKRSPGPPGGETGPDSTMVCNSASPETAAVLDTRDASHPLAVNSATCAGLAAAVACAMGSLDSWSQPTYGVGCSTEQSQEAEVHPPTALAEGPQDQHSALPVLLAATPTQCRRSPTEGTEGVKRLESLWVPSQHQLFYAVDAEAKVTEQPGASSSTLGGLRGGAAVVPVR